VPGGKAISRFKPFSQLARLSAPADHSSEFTWLKCYPFSEFGSEFGSFDETDKDCRASKRDTGRERTGRSTWIHVRSSGALQFSARQVRQKRIRCSERKSTEQARGVLQPTGVQHGKEQHRGRQANSQPPAQRLPARLRKPLIQTILPQNGSPTPPAGNRMGPPGSS
jgi:hypothetical protein